MDGEFDTEEYILNTSKVTMPTAADMVATFGTVTWYKTRLFFFTPGPYTFQCRARPPHDPPVLGEFEISFPLKIQWPRQPQYTPPFGN